MSSEHNEHNEHNGIDAIHHAALAITGHSPSHVAQAAARYVQRLTDSQLCVMIGVALGVLPASDRDERIRTIQEVVEYHAEEWLEMRTAEGRRALLSVFEALQQPSDLTDLLVFDRHDETTRMTRFDIGAAQQKVKAALTGTLDHFVERALETTLTDNDAQIFTEIMKRPSTATADVATFAVQNTGRYLFKKDDLELAFDHVRNQITVIDRGASAIALDCDGAFQSPVSIGEYLHVVEAELSGMWGDRRSNNGDPLSRESLLLQVKRLDLCLTTVGAQLSRFVTEEIADMATAARVRHNLHRLVYRSAASRPGEG